MTIGSTPSGNLRLLWLFEWYWTEAVCVIVADLGSDFYSLVWWGDIGSFKIVLTTEGFWFCLIMILVYTGRLSGTFVMFAKDSYFLMTWLEVIKFYEFYDELAA